MDEKIQVFDGFCLKCSMGSSESAIKVPVCHGACISGKNQATVSDYKSGVNITSFGTCSKRTPSEPCTPVILTPWLIVDKNYKISGEAVLFSTSILSCACGGIIHVSKKL